MKNLISIFFICFVQCLFVTNVFAENSPIGFWKTIDDTTGQPKAVVEISEDANHFLSGRIVKIFPHPGVNPNELCLKCNGDKKNKPILGMTILTNMKKTTDNLWKGGDILDPKNGKTYRSTLQLLQNGQSLNVRGYIGLPLFGRTQTWVRMAKT